MDTTYRKAPTLQDVLPGAVGADPNQAPADQTSVAPGLDQTQSELLRLLTTPESTGPAPTVDKLTTWDKIRLGIGDALGASFQTYGSVLAGGGIPHVRSNYDEFLRRQDQSKADLADWQRRNEQARSDAKLRGVNFLERKQARADEQAGREQLKQMTIAQQELDRQARVAAAAQAAQYHADEIASREKIANAEITARQKSDELQAALHRAKATDEADKDQHDEYKKVRMWAVANKGDIIAKIQKGEITTDQVRQTLSDMLDASDLTGKYLEAARAFLDLQLGVPMERHDFAQKYEPQGPEHGDFPVPKGATTLRNPRGVGGGI